MLMMIRIRFTSPFLNPISQDTDRSSLSLQWTNSKKNQWQSCGCDFLPNVSNMCSSIPIYSICNPTFFLTMSNAALLSSAISTPTSCEPGELHVTSSIVPHLRHNSCIRVRVRVAFRCEMCYAQTHTVFVVKGKKEDDGGSATMASTIPYTVMEGFTHIYAKLNVYLHPFCAANVQQGVREIMNSLLLR